MQSSSYLTPLQPGFNFLSTSQSQSQSSHAITQAAMSGSTIRELRASNAAPKTLKRKAAPKDESDSEPEQKRNKLGYQRSTIACGMLIRL